MSDEVVLKLTRAEVETLLKLVQAQPELRYLAAKLRYVLDPGDWLELIDAGDVGEGAEYGEIDGDGRAVDPFEGSDDDWLYPDIDDDPAYS